MSVASKMLLKVFAEIFKNIKNLKNTLKSMAKTGKMYSTYKIGDINTIIIESKACCIRY